MNHSEIFNNSQTAKQYRVKQSRSLTPSQRMDAFVALQTQAMETLASNPDALAAFHRRNHHQRRQSNVCSLETLMKRRSVLGDDE